MKKYVEWLHGSPKHIATSSKCTSKSKFDFIKFSVMVTKTSPLYLIFCILAISIVTGQATLTCFLTKFLGAWVEEGRPKEECATVGA